MKILIIEKDEEISSALKIFLEDLKHECTIIDSINLIHNISFYDHIFLDHYTYLIQNGSKLIKDYSKIIVMTTLPNIVNDHFKGCPHLRIINKPFTLDQIENYLCNCL